MHLGVSSMPQRYRYVPKQLTQVLNLFSATHKLQGRSESDGRQTAGATKNWAGGMELSHAALHDSRRLKPEFTSTAEGASRMQALCTKQLCPMDKGMKGVVSVQLCLERHLESGIFPMQVGWWNA